MNQSHSQPSFSNKPLQNMNRIRESVPPLRLNDPPVYFVWEHEIKKVLSPYWAARSETAGFSESF